MSQMYRERTAMNREFGAAGVSQFIPVAPEQINSLRASGVRLFTESEVNAAESYTPESYTPPPVPQPAAAAPGVFPRISFVTVPKGGRRGGRRKTRRVTKKRKTMKRKHYRK